VEIDVERKMHAILRVLAEADGPLGSTSIARELQSLGTDLKQRMIRYYLKDLDRLGFTENLGRAGRKITEHGLREFENTAIMEKVGLSAARIDELVYKMSFDLSRATGNVVVNVSRFRAADAKKALDRVAVVTQRRLGMGRLVAVGREGDTLCGFPVAYGELGLGSVCSVTLNGVFRLAGIPMRSRFGGLLELRDCRPLRFTQIIHYEGTTIDPVQIFLKGKMTRVRQAAETGNGVIGAGFREMPAAAYSEALRVIDRLEQVGLGCVLAVGRPGRPLLDIPVSPGRVSLIVAAGLNALAAV